MTDKNNKKPHYNKWLAMINIPFQMGIIIFLFVFIGDWLDENHPHPRIYYIKLLTIIGVFIALYTVFKQIINISKKS
jgi:hypothetical protein